VNAADLRRYAIARTLWRAPTPAEAVARLGFVQYDPIRAPACAQDLILRHRVDGYRPGDLDRAYREHALDETFLHVYGVMPREHADRLHPRGGAAAWRVEREHPGLASRVLRHVRKHGVAHPRMLAQKLEATAMVNGWGGASSATTRALDMLQYQGAVRVMHRDGGIRVYAPSPKRPRAIGPSQRAETVLSTLLALYAPVPAATLRYLAWMAGGRGLSSNAERAKALVRFAKDALVASATVDGVRYLYPAGEDPSHAEPDDRVRALAPFDPIAWDRDRFEHLWGWGYRFEAYTPAAKRVYGYYALPLAWRDRVVGWVNATPSASGLAFDVGYPAGAPRDRGFRRALDEELASLEAFLR
jgi:uncharacterized protein YcaQ